MRSLKVAILLVVSAAVVGCDSDQPLQLGEQTISIDFTAANASATNLHVWDVYEDTAPQDGQPDGEVSLHCLPATQQTVQPVTVPLGFAVEIVRIPSGTSEREVLTPALALDPEANFVHYDTAVQRGVSGLPTRPVPPVGGPFVNTGGTTNCWTYQGTRRFCFGDPRRVTRANEAVLAATSNLLDLLEPGYFNPFVDGNGDIQTFRGLCSLFYPGPAGIAKSSPTAGLPLPLELTVREGDTVIVTVAPGTSSESPVPFTGDAVLSGSMTLDGLPLTVQGSPSSTGGAGEAFSFWFTVR